MFLIGYTNDWHLGKQTCSCSTQIILVPITIKTVPLPSPTQSCGEFLQDL